MKMFEYNQKVRHKVTGNVGVVKTIRLEVQRTDHTRTELGIRDPHARATEESLGNVIWSAAEVDDLKDFLTHQEHCCMKHGCKYNEWDCPMVVGRAGATRSCEVCDEEGAEKLRIDRAKTRGVQALRRLEEWAICESAPEPEGWKLIAKDLEYVRDAMELLQKQKELKHNG